MANPNPTKIVNFTDNPKPPAAGKGRPKGARNKTTLFLKDAIIRAAELSGEDKTGQDGLIGYCRMLAENEPKAFAALLGKVLPIQVHATGGEDDEGNQLPMRVEVVIVDPKA